jgi:hypothetical protein
MPVPNGGKDMQTNVKNLNEAIKILLDKEIEFINVAHLPVEFKHTTQREEPLHYYFMNSDRRDVAYYTPSCKSLWIHDEPRIWDEYFLDRVEWMGQEETKKRKEIVKTLDLPTECDSMHD